MSESRGSGSWWLAALPAAAGAIVALVGMIVLIGWLTGSPALVQLIPAFEPMQYNEALGFLLAGAAILSLGAGRKALAVLAALLLLLLSGLTLIQFGTGWDLGIDNLLLDRTVTVGTRHAGRMAPNAAICFTLAAVALLVSAARTRLRDAVIATLAVIIAALGTLGLTGYMTAVPTAYGWGQLTRMAVLASAAMILMGAALFVRAWRASHDADTGLSPRWLPIAAGVGGLTTTLCLWQAMYAVEQQNIERRLSEAAGLHETFVNESVTGYAMALERIAGRWTETADSAWWRVEARQLTRASGSYLALQLREDDGTVRLSIAAPGEAGPSGEQLLAGPQLSLLNRARARRRTTIAHEAGTSNRGAAFIVAVPLEAEGGFMVGTLAVADMLERSIPPGTAGQFQITLAAGGTELITRPAASLAEARWQTVRSFEMGGNRWELRLWPSRTAISTMQAGVDEAVLLVGIALSVLIAFLLRFGQEAQRRAKELAHANAVLSREMASRATIERALRESEQRYRDLTERSQGFIWIHDLEGRILTVNPAAAQALGYAPDDMLGHNMAEYLTDASRAGFPQYLESMRTSTDLSGTIEFQTRGGRRCIWSFSNTLYREGDNPIYVLANAQDVTRLKEAEAELERARDAAVESARLKSEFLANMSHEIRTPLNGVIGMTDLLLTTELTREQREFTETIRASADSLLTIVNDILDFSKIEAGMLAFETLDFGLRNLVESTLEMFAEPAKRKNLDLACLVYSDVPDALRGDPGRLRQVLTNLIGNAVKFTLAGEVTVRVTKEQESETHALIRFAISDTGIGISPEQRKRLFQPFTQADGSTARQFGGTGLGLAISKQLVEAMDGQIDLASEPGVGSTFWFTALLEKQPAVDAANQNDVSLHDLRVLIVDDNETNRSIIRHYVTSWGMRPEEATTGAEALAMLSDAADSGEPFSLAIMDLMMPGMTGFELARMIKSDPKIAGTRLVLMPSFGKRGHANDAREAGISAYLVKPIRQSELHDCLVAVVSDRMDPVEPTPRLVTRHSLNENSRRPRQRILIAEDNLVNQKVLMAQVSKLGYRADLVNNGEEALTALERYPYALVLMDCQMPKLDGYAATREIRARERNGRRIPIVAVTANALQGEREKCEEAGMDDYLSKPVKQDDLRAVIERWLPADAAPAAPVVSEQHADAGIIYKAADITGGFRLPPRSPNGNGDERWSSMRERVDELRAECGIDLLMSLIEMFMVDAEMKLEELRTHVATRNASGIHDAAHALKGSCLNFGADPVANLLQELEDRGEAGELDGCEDLLIRIQSEFRELRPLLMAG